MKKLILLIGIFSISINFAYAKETVEFDSCIDGDSIKVIIAGEKYSVRMIAIDTPESVHPTKGVEYYGKEASEYTCSKVQNANKIELEYDENCSKTDKYGRIMAWVFVDGKLLQKDLVANGYAKVGYLYDDYKYTKELETVQELASAKNLGVWNETAKEKYETNQGDSSSNLSDKSKEQSQNIEQNNYSTQEIIIIGILLLIIIFVGDKTIKRKAKKKLKKYLK